LTGFSEAGWKAHRRNPNNLNSLFMKTCGES
jgi:hypothetical protein